MVPARGDETVGTDGGGVPGEGVRAGARRDPVRIDGSLHSGSGSIVRQAAVLAALTRRPVTLANARIRRPHPGLRHQHVAVLEAVRALVEGDLAGATAGSRTFSFRPGAQRPAGRYDFDIATAGSATLLALAVLPLVSLRGGGVDIEIRGGLFQDFAPSLFHLQHVVLPTLAEMGLSARLEMLRPGYVPGGQGVLRVSVTPAPARLQPLVRPRAGAVRAVWGIAFASHLRDRRVTTRMAASAREVLSKAGIPAEIEERDDTSAAQAGATFALFAELEGAPGSGRTVPAHRIAGPRRSGPRSPGCCSRTSQRAPRSTGTPPTSSSSSPRSQPARPPTGSRRQPPTSTPRPGSPGSFSARGFAWRERL